MEEWIKKYFEGSQKDQTRFAVMGCGNKQNGDVTPLLYLNGKATVDLKGTTPAERINDAQYKVRYKEGEYWDNVEDCARSTVNQIFQTDNGDRADAKNVVFCKCKVFVFCKYQALYSVSVKFCIL